MNDIDAKLQALLDDRRGARRDAGLRSATLDPETRRQLGAYKALYRALAEDQASLLPADFAARVTAQAFGDAQRSERGLAPWLVAALAIGGGVLLAAASLAVLVPEPERVVSAFYGPVGPLVLALAIAPLLDGAIARVAAARRG